MASKKPKPTVETSDSSRSALRTSLPILPNLDAFPGTGYSRWSDLRPFVRFSREWVRLQEIAGRFPRRVQMSKTCVMWPNVEVKRWLDDPLNYKAGA